MPPLIAFHSLSRTFHRAGGFFRAADPVYAVRDVSLSVDRGQTLGIVGESGCGKSTLGKMAVGLLKPTSGEVRFMGNSLPPFRSGKQGQETLGGRIQMVFQDPYSSLNPRMLVLHAIEEPLRWIDASLSADRRRILAEEMLERVELGREAGRRYPHEFSGGQRQRIAIARALITNPLFVVCDEPTSSLDASVQAQVLNLLKDMQDSLGLAYMFISHDLAVVRHMADAIAVMYQGLVVEAGPASTIFASPLHPYTRLLLESAGLSFSAQESKARVSGETMDSAAVAGYTGNAPGTPKREQVLSACHEALYSEFEEVCPSAEESINGEGSVLCPFLPRCPVHAAICEEMPVPLIAFGETHRVRCLFA